MKRTTITLPDQVAAAVEREAHQYGISMSEVVRKALAKALDLDDSKPSPPRFSNLGHSGYTDTAQRAEEILATHWHCASFDIVP